MPQYESFYRGDPVGRESRSLPAEQYNAIRLLLDFSGKSCVFVPIRSMQYMAVIDREEVIFIDGQVKSEIDFAWRFFRSQERSTLTEPVTYTFEYYVPDAPVTMRRAQGEFFRHVRLLAGRLRQQEKPVDSSNNVVSFPPRQ